MSLSSTRSSKLLWTFVALASVVLIHLIYQIYLEHGDSNQISIKTSDQVSDLEQRLKGIAHSEESILKLLDGLQTSTTTLESGISTFQEKLDAALKTIGQKEDQLQRLREEQNALWEELTQTKDQLHTQVELTEATKKTLQEADNGGGKKNQHRVFDIFTLNDELDLLEIRLNELYDIMDVFVIIECEISFTNQPKKLYYAENEARFRAFRDKILHIVIPPASDEDRDVFYSQEGKWLMESYTRDKGLHLAIQARKPNEADWVMISDVDEIPRREFIQQLQSPDLSTELGRQVSQDSEETFGDLFKVSCLWYMFSFEFKLPRDCPAPVLIRFRDEDSPIFEKEGYPDMSNFNHLREDNWIWTGQQLRSKQHADVPMIRDQCYHCSYCFPKLQQIVNKIESFSYRELDVDKYKDPKWILDHVRSGVDIFDRWTEATDYVEDNKELPTFVQQNPDRFAYMLKRKGIPNAEFDDIPNNTPLYDPAHPFIDQPMKPLEEEDEQKDQNREVDDTGEEDVTEDDDDTEYEQEKMYEMDREEEEDKKNKDDKKDKDIKKENKGKNDNKGGQAQREDKQTNVKKDKPIEKIEPGTKQELKRSLQ